MLDCISRLGGLPTGRFCFFICQIYVPLLFFNGLFLGGDMISSASQIQGLDCQSPGPQ